MIDLEVFEQEIAILLDWFNRDLEQTTLKRLYQCLSAQLTTEQFVQASQILFQTCRFFPTVEEFVSVVKGAPETQALEEWESCVKAAARADNSIVDQLSGAGQFALRSVGGVSGLGRATEDELKWTKKEFVSAWKGWAPAVGPALPPASPIPALPQGVGTQMSQQVRSLSQKMSLNGKSKA